MLEEIKMHPVKLILLCLALVLYSGVSKSSAVEEDLLADASIFENAFGIQSIFAPNISLQTFFVDLFVEPA